MEPSLERASASIVLGPGRRLAGLETLLTALGVRFAPQLTDLGQLPALPATSRVLLDADGIAVEDVGLIRRVAARIVLTGEDSGRRVVKELSRTANVHWIGWPLDLEDIATLLGPDATRAGESPRAPATETNGAGDARAPAASRAADELARIEAILAMPTDAEGSARSTPSATGNIDAIRRANELRDDARSAATDRRSAPMDERVRAEGAERAPDDECIPDVHAPSVARIADAPPGSSPTPRGAPALPSFFRDQVADLADIAQRIELATSALGEDAPIDPALTGDVARLVQFTRTLGFLAAPPGPGEQLFDVAEALEVAVAAHVGQDEDGPRFLFRSDGPLWVRSDRELLGLAFDAYLTLARSAGRRGEIVRVQVRASDAPTADGDELGSGEIAIEFPAGPLAELDPARIVEPYALRRVFPMLGANALSAATSIVRGQGGRAELVRAPRGRLLWRAEISRAEPPSARATAARTSARRGAAADDPFA